MNFYFLIKIIEKNLYKKYFEKQKCMLLINKNNEIKNLNLILLEKIKKKYKTYEILVLYNKQKKHYL